MIVNRVEISILLILAVNTVMGFTLVNEVRTPSLLIDMDRLLESMGQEATHTHAPALYLPKHDVTFYPKDLPGIHGNGNDQELKKDWNWERYDLSKYKGQSALVYLHSSVIRVREDAMGDTNMFLAELDLAPPSALASENARLVLGINNHHVGSYYWARSVGMGASMEAPGVYFGQSHAGKGILRWETEGGSVDCNSNDGKRSEWVNFLRIGDNVQLLPVCNEDALLAFSERFNNDSEAVTEDKWKQSNTCHIYGFTSKGRPLGSEPIIVCEWLKRTS